MTTVIKKFIMRKIIFALLVAVVSVAVASCSLFGTGTSDVSFGVTGNPQAAFPGRSAAARGVSVDVGGASLEITKVEMVMFELDMTVPDSTDKDDYEVGPLLLDLPLGKTIESVVDGLVIPAGIYEALEIEVKIPEGHEEQATFEEMYPDWDITKSVRVVGTYNGDDFDLYLDFNDDFKLDFDPPITITDEGGQTVVLAIDVSTWFLTDDGSALIDPRSIDLEGPDAAQIEDNIEDSFEAFEDL